MSKQQKKYNLGMAGEYLVTGELTRRGISASMTYGNAKKADVVAFSPDQNTCAVVEVKTTGEPRWITGNKLPEKNNLIWVFVFLKDTESPRYFIMTGEQLFAIFVPLEIAAQQRYFKTHGFYSRELGVVKLPQSLALPYENNWGLFESIFST